MITLKPTNSFIREWISNGFSKKGYSSDEGKRKNINISHDQLIVHEIIPS